MRYKFGFNSEPALIAGAIRAVILALAAFGFNLTAEQTASIMLAVEAVLTVAVRQNVTSQDTLHAAGLTQRGVTQQAEATTGKQIP